MGHKRNRIIMTVVLLASVLLGLVGCTKKNEPEEIEGGTTTRRDDNAPKEIKSKDITGLNTNVFLESRWFGAEEHFFVFNIKKDEAGNLIASEERSGVSAAADDELLSGICDIIDKNNLVAKNGLYDVTAGLPPEFQECTLTVDYASGERLYFTENNDPSAAWAVELYDLFARWFDKKGNHALYPDRETSKVSRLDLLWEENGEVKGINGINVSDEDAIDGQTYLLEKETYRSEDVSGYERSFITFPDDFYDRVTGIIDSYNLVREYDFTYFDHHDGYYITGTKPEDESDMVDGRFEMYVEFESGKRMNIETKKRSQTEALRPVADDLFAYIEPYFDENGICPDDEENASAGEEDQFYITEITDDIKARIEGKSYKEDCTLPMEDLRYLHVLHKDKDGNVREGEMVVNY
ncbi:MAG: hypothetical protein J5842_06950, partial [Lachnospiraceae bacterium]|nr:hypothetical protein [Lachnospiraceae bacterium]